MKPVCLAQIFLLFNVGQVPCSSKNGSVDHCDGSLELDSEIAGGEVDWRVDVGVVPADLGMRSLGMCRWTLLCSNGTMLTSSFVIAFYDQR